jgi:hypothetical protein
MHARQRVTRSSFTHPLHPIVAPHPLPALRERVWSAEDWATLELGYESDRVLSWSWCSARICWANRFLSFGLGSRR